MATSPYDRIRESSVNALSAIELLAMGICQSEEDLESAISIARKLMQRVGGIRGIPKIPPDLLADSGVKGFQAARFYSLIELGRRTADAGIGDLVAIEKPEDVVKLFADLRGERREHFCALLLDAKNRVLRRHTVHIGTITSSMVGIREFFREAVREGAVSVIAVHNHPSGDPKPSPEDIEITRVLVEAGKLLEIPLLDHIIIGEPEFTSLNRLGCIS
ncbi:MAG TPA: DNA repair protein RadC [Fimbriimonadales bacterium]|nr:DNA repair protein RadC [Fimbriimonadales bacterium]